MTTTSITDPNPSPVRHFVPYPKVLRAFDFSALLVPGSSLKELKVALTKDVYDCMHKSTGNSMALFMVRLSNQLGLPSAPTDELKAHKSFNETMHCVEYYRKNKLPKENQEDLILFRGICVIFQMAIINHLISSGVLPSSYSEEGIDQISIVEHAQSTYTIECSPQIFQGHIA